MKDKKEKRRIKLQKDIRDYQRYVVLLNELRTDENKCPLCQGTKFGCDRCIAGIRFIAENREECEKDDELISLRERLGKKYFCESCDGQGSFQFKDENGDYFYEDCGHCNGNQIVSPEEEIEDVD